MKSRNKKSSSSRFKPQPEDLFIIPNVASKSDSQLEEELNKVARMKPSLLNVSDIKVVKNIAVGGQACVKKVLVDNVTYAMKVIPIQEDEAQILKNLLCELKALYACSHKNIIRVEEVFSKQGIVYVLMEFMSAGSLDNILKVTKTIPEDVLSVICFYVLEAMAFIHAKKIIHRDVKPGNILLSKEGAVKLSDFGMAGNDQTVYSTFQGTNAFMSPERLRGEDYTVNADIWSLGMTVIQCAIGRFPFETTGSSIWEILAFLDGDNLITKVVKEGNFSEDFIDFLSKCLVENVRSRPSADILLKHQFIQKAKSQLSSSSTPNILQHWLNEKFLNIMKERKSLSSSSSSGNLDKY